MSYVRKKIIRGRVYYYEVASVWENGRSKQKVLRYLGTADKLAKQAKSTPITDSELSVEESVHYGSVAALHAIASEVDLAGTVARVIPKGGGPDIGKLFEAMVINRCLEPVSRHRLPEWYEVTALPRLLELPSGQVTEDTLYRALGYFTDERVVRIQRELWSTLKDKGADAGRVFYDLTSTYFEGHAVTMAKHGYSRDHRSDKIQINLAVAVNRQGFPITHKVLEGNVADVTTVQEANATLREKFLVKEAILVLDRGMMSKENREAMRAANTPYIAGVRMDPGLQRFVASRPTADFVQASPEDPRYFVQKATREGRRLIIVWNKQKEKDDHEWRMNALARAEEELAKIRNRSGIASLRTKAQILTKARNVLKKQGVAPFITLTVNEQGPPSLSWRRNTSKLRWEARWDGRFALETNTSLQDAEVFWAYHERDVVEKFLQSMKSIVELRPVHVYKETHVKAHVFVCVTSVLLLQLLRDKLKKAGIPLSAVRALDRLDSVMEIVVKQGEELLRVLSRRAEDQVRLLTVAGAPTTL